MTRRRRLRIASAVLALATLAAGPPGRVSRPRLPWTRLHNPILGLPDRAVKDPALVSADGRWYALFSQVTSDLHWSIGVADSADLRRWSPPTAMPHDPAVEGEASPDVSRAPDGTFVVTYQSFVHDSNGAAPKLYYRTTTDFARFSPARALGHELHPGSADRMIDAAVAWTPAGLLLGYKYGTTDGPQAFEIARSTSGSLDGPWVEIGRPRISVFGDTIENYQILDFRGRWRLLATSNRFDRPYLFELTGNPHDPTGWLRWSRGRQLRVPQQRWNPGRGSTGATYEHANCAFLVDRGRTGRYVYLVYADSPELTTFGGAGHARLGLARSTDLVRWAVP